MTFNFAILLYIKLLQVTIFGESAGGMSVSHHFLSKKSQALFQRAIAQSGVSTSAFMHLDKNPIFYAR